MSSSALSTINEVDPTDLLLLDGDELLDVLLNGRLLDGDELNFILLTARLTPGEAVNRRFPKQASWASPVTV